MPTRLPTFSKSILPWLILLGLVPLLAVLASVRLLQSHAQTAATSQMQQIAARAAACRIEERLASATALIEHARDTAAQSDASIRFPLQASRTFQAVMILDGRGTVRSIALRDDLASRKGELAGLDLSQLVSALLPTTQVTTASSGIVSVLDNRPLLTIHARLADGGSIVAILDGALLWQSIDPSRPPGLWLIATRSGQTIAYSPSMPPSVIAQALSGNGSAPTGPVCDFAQTTIDPAGWTLWYQAPPTALETVWDRFRTGAMLAAATASILAAVAALLLARIIAKPISRLSAQTIAAISAGDGSPLAPQHIAETQTIAHALRQTLDTTSQQHTRYAAFRRALASAATPGKSDSPHATLADAAASLAALTSARCILVAEWSTDAKPRAQVLAGRTAIPLPPDFSYELTGHPSSHLAPGGSITIASHVSRQYPESPLLRLVGAEGYTAVPLVSCRGAVIGHIEIIDDHNLAVSDELQDLLLVIAGRAAGALEQIQSQRRIDRSDELFQAITQDQQEITCRWTADTTLTFVGEPFCRITGKPREQLLGRSLLSVLHEDDGELIRSRAMELSADHPVQSVDARLHSAGGDDLWHRWTLRALPDAKGRLVEYQGTARDITQVLDLQAALAEAQTRFALLADNSDAAFWITDWKTHRCIYANPAFQALWGITPDALRGAALAWSAAIHEEDRANIVRRYLLHAAEGQYAQTYRIVRPDGQIKLIRDRAVPVRDADGHAYRVANIAQEITRTNSE